ncbi:AmmeMemoRadiSam system radical SAM enzyme [bacterium 3DAC]|nr:AmmeMemoRadiSam system radical SAM enzyme [bacterium 3DAC]
MNKYGFFQEIDKGVYRCTACPFKCILKEGVRGYCGVRTVVHGKPVSLMYGYPVSIAVDPIEKKPLFHFHPGTKVLSFGTLGCNMRCKGCQNWEIAHTKPEEWRYQFYHIEPQEVPYLMKETGANGVAFTYNEPTVWAEYVYDASYEVKKAGGYTVAVTNGYFSEEVREAWAEVVDAYAIDLKAMFKETYAKFAPGIKPEIVLDNIKWLFNRGKHIEVIVNLMPGVNDSDEERKAMIDFLVSVSTDIPFHITRFYPMYQMRDIPPTPIEELLQFREEAKSAGLKYVYVGNVRIEGVEDTYCPNCGTLLVKREGFWVSLNKIDDGKCVECGYKIYGVW